MALFAVSTGCRDGRGLAAFSLLICKWASLIYKAASRQGQYHECNLAGPLRKAPLECLDEPRTQMMSSPQPTTLVGGRLGALMVPRTTDIAKPPVSQSAIRRRSAVTSSSR